MTTTIRLGSLFTGYGGLDMGVAMALAGARVDVQWVADVEDGPRRVLARHWPDAPNLGDVTGVDWARTPRVDVICGGSPCQDMSLAGERRGMRPGTRSGLWDAMARAVLAHRPRLVAWENVEGALSSGAHSRVEPSPGRVGDGSGRPALRAIGRVLGDLADAGYDARWAVVRASDVGAPHRRGRVFLIAHPHGDTWGSLLPLLGDPDSEPRDVRGEPAPGEAPQGRAHGLAGGPGRAPAPHLIPTPTASDHKAGRHQAGKGMSLSQAVRTLPAVTTMDVAYSSQGYGPTLGQAVRSLHAEGTFGPYEAAVRRWEAVIGRPAPAPTEPSPTTGRPRLSTRFVEHMMGLPDGHVTGPALGLTRAQQLSLLGNGVVPQQAAHAVRTLITEGAADE